MGYDVVLDENLTPIAQGTTELVEEFLQTAMECGVQTEGWAIEIQWLEKPVSVEKYLSLTKKPPKTPYKSFEGTTHLEVPPNNDDLEFFSNQLHEITYEPETHDALIQSFAKGLINFEAFNRISLVMNKKNSTGRDPYMEEQSLFVEKFFVNNGSTDTIIPYNSQLENGMKVIIATPGSKQDLREIQDDPQKHYLAMMENRWATITELSLKGRDAISFIGLYDDGTTIPREYGGNRTWYVKKNTMPGQPGNRKPPVGTNGKDES